MFEEKSLDDSEYRAAFLLLDSACRYLCRGKMTEGPGAIIAAYQAIDVWAQATFQTDRAHRFAGES